MDTDRLLDAGIGLAVLFVVLQALGVILTGTPYSNWSTGVNQASSFVGIALIILIVSYVRSLSKHRA
jgi:hypothetical protein